MEGSIVLESGISYVIPKYIKQRENPEQRPENTGVCTIWGEHRVMQSSEGMFYGIESGDAD